VLNEVPADLSAVLIAKVGTMVVLPRRHRLAAQRTLSVADLDGERLVLPQQGSPQREALAAAFSAVGATLAPAVEASGWDVLLHFARLGLGLAVVNDFCATPAGMIAKPLRGLQTVSYYAARRRDAQLNDSARQLEALLQK
jgi:LysR family transcriptional regulator, low CO2-responsive transcriptional regulator